MDAEYSVERDANNTAVRLLRAGVEVPINPESQEFCDFLSWDSRQPDSLDESIGTRIKGNYFADIDRLVDQVKRLAIRLFVGDQSPNALIANSSFRLPALNLRLWHLQEAVGRPVFTDAESQSGIYGWPINPPMFVTEPLLQRIAEQLNDESSGIRRLSSLPIRRAFLYLDISDFSRRPPGQQALIMNVLMWITQDEKLWNYQFAHEVRIKHEAMLCIGDGYIFVFRNAIDATYYASHIANVIERLVAIGGMPVDFHFRMGVHVGRVYCFWDIGRNNWNYIGDGINGGNRVLSAIGKETDDVIFISADVRQEIMAQDVETEPYKRTLANLQNRGRRNDKHGRPWRVYEVNHTSVAPLPTLTPP